MVDIELMGVHNLAVILQTGTDRLSSFSGRIYTHILMPKEHDIVFLLDSIIVILLCLYTEHVSVCASKPVEHAI